MRVLMFKTAQGTLAPANTEATELLAKLKLGQETWVDVVRARVTPFHKKWFALLGIGYEAWEPPALAEGPFAGLQPEKNFDQFRKDVTIHAGFYEVEVSISGRARVSAKSVSFDKMSQEEFERLYSATINVLLKFVLRHKSEAELRAWVDQILRFA